MLRVVVDTNVFISALVYGGLPEAFLSLAFEHKFFIVTSSILLDELDRKLQVRFGFTSPDAAVVLKRIEACALITPSDAFLKVIKNDPADDRILECAILGNADYIVSGDRHLLTLGSYQNIPIVTIRRFMDSFA